MSDYKEVTDSVEVPSHSGVEGFLAAIRRILRLPRVTRVEIDASGKVNYTRYMRAEEPRKTIEVDFDSVSPGALIRNIALQEIDVSSAENAAVCVAALFYAASLDHMYPVAFVTGANTVFHEWHYKTAGVRLGGERAYGLPLHRDRFLPDEALVLATAYAPNAGLVDCQKSYKISMPSRQAPIRLAPEVLVDLLPAAVSGETVLVAAEAPRDHDVRVIP